MKIRALYQKIYPEKFKLKVKYEKTNKSRPAWIEIKGLPKDIGFIRIHLGKDKKGDRIIAYKTYLQEGLFLPIDYNAEEMKRFYDKFSETYDKQIKECGKGTPGQNILAAKFLVKKLKKFIQKGEMLDLGAGTGLISEIFVKEGFSPCTLVDYSEKMLEKAKKKNILKNCKFIKEDIRKLNLKKKFDLIVSCFSFASSSYFKEEELDGLFNRAKKHLKKKGIIVIMGHTHSKKLEKHFKKLDSGIYDLSTKKRFYSDYFIGENSK